MAIQIRDEHGAVVPRKTTGRKVRKVPLPEKAKGLTLNGCKPSVLQVEGLDTPLEHIRQRITLVHGKLHDRGISLLGQVLLKAKELEPLFDETEWGQLDAALATFGLRRGMVVQGWGNAGFDRDEDVR